MAFGFVCFELDGVTVQNIGAVGTPAFLRTLPASLAPSGGSRAYYQGGAPGLPPYASTTTTRAALSAGLAAAQPTSFVPVDFLENEDTPPTITVNAVGEIASLQPLPVALLAPSVVAAVRLTYTGGAYCDVQGDIASVTAAINAAIPPAASTTVPPANVVWVDPTAVLAGVRGNQARPFATVALAVAAMRTGDELRLPAQRVATLPTAWPVLDAQGNPFLEFTISGEGPLTRLSAVGLNVPVLSLAAGARQFVSIRNLYLEEDNFPNLQMSIRADGSALALGALDTLVLQDVVAINMELHFWQQVICDNVSVPNVGSPAWILEGCEQKRMRSLYAVNLLSMQVIDSHANPLSPGPLTPLHFDGACRISNPSSLITLSGQASIIQDKGSRLGLIEGATLTEGPGGELLTLILNGGVQGLDFGGLNSSLPDSPAGPPEISLAGCTLGGGAVSFAVQAPAANRVPVECQGAAFNSPPSFGAGIDAHCRGSSFSQNPAAGGLVTAGTGTVVPPPFALGPVVIAAGLVLPFVIPFTLPGTDFTVAVEGSDQTTLPAGVGNKTATGFDVTIGFAVAGAELRALVAYQG